MTTPSHDDERPARQLGLEKGAVYPATAASGLVHPARRLLHPPGRLVRRLSPGADAEVLEIGPGAGWFSRELAAAVPRGRLHLLDVQPDMLALARARAASPVVDTETRTDPDFVPHARLLQWAEHAGLRPVSRHGRLLGYTAVLEREAPIRGA